MTPEQFKKQLYAGQLSSDIYYKVTGNLELIELIDHEEFFLDAFKRENLEILQRLLLLGVAPPTLPEGHRETFRRVVETLFSSCDWEYYNGIFADFNETSKSKHTDIIKGYPDLQAVNQFPDYLRVDGDLTIISPLCCAPLPKLLKVAGNFTLLYGSKNLPDSLEVWKSCRIAIKDLVSLPPDSILMHGGELVLKVPLDHNEKLSACQKILTSWLSMTSSASVPELSGLSGLQDKQLCHVSLFFEQLRALVGRSSSALTAVAHRVANILPLLISKTHIQESALALISKAINTYFDDPVHLLVLDNLESFLK